MFTECYRKDEERAQKLLVRVSEAWGKTTCLQLALEAKDMKFVSHGGVQVTFWGLDTSAVVLWGWSRHPAYVAGTGSPASGVQSSRRPQGQSSAPHPLSPGPLEGSGSGMGGIFLEG